MISSVSFNILIIGIVTFGGGQVFIPLFKKMMVDDLNLSDIGEFFNIVAFANAFPGPFATKLAFYSGYLDGGFFGMLMAALAIGVPGYIIMYFSCRNLEKIKHLDAIKYINTFIKPIIAAIFLSLTYDLFKDSLKNLELIHNLILTILTIVLLSFKKVKINLLIIMIIACIYGFFFF